MNFKKKFFTYNLIFNDKIFRRQGTTFRPSKIKQFYKNTYYYNFINRKLKNNSSFENTQNTYNTQSFKLNIASTDAYLLKGLDFTLKRPEVKIPRVRFKPGYKRI